MSKFVFLKSLRELLVPLKHLIDKKAENVNWNENDPAAKGYIANRTHYKAVEQKTFLNNKKLNFYNEGFAYVTDFSPGLELNIGDSVTVIWDGKEYNVKAYALEGVAIGNSSIVPFYPGLDTGEPFLIQSNSDQCFVATSDTANSHTITIFGDVTVVHKIPSEYLPEISSVGKECTAEGAEIFNDYENNIASDYCAHAEGNNTEASGYSSHAEGQMSVASGYYTHAEGYSTTASGNKSHAEGGGTIASGDYSHSEGNDTRAIGYNSHAEGRGTIAFGEGSHIEGCCLSYLSRVRASGAANDTTYTIASIPSQGLHIGEIVRYNNTYAKIINIDKENLTITLSNTLASSTLNSVYIYFYSGASGIYSHAEGLYTIASEHSSHAEGWGTVAASAQQHAQGKYNIEDSENKYSHIVGNGTSGSARKNAHTLDWNGLGWFAGGLKVGGTGQDDANAKSVATESYVNEKIATIDVSDQLAALVDSAPETLNTLNELANALGDDPNFATTVTTKLGTITNQIDSVSQQIKEPKNSIMFIDQVNGYRYIACMRDGNLVTYCITTSIEVATMPTKTQYYVGDSFDPTGMVIIANVDDGTIREITNYSYSTEPLVENIISIEIVYIEGDNKYTVNVPITVKPVTDLLIDFNYINNNNGTYTLKAWKGTLNGEPSTEIIVPDNRNIIL